MKYRVRDIPLILLGATGSDLLLGSLIIVATLLSGVPVTRRLISLRRRFDVFTAVLGFAATHIGLSGWWHHTILPAVTSFESFIFTYWWILIYLLIWLALCPVVAVVTYVTNFFVRLLGYRVRPFPGGFLDKFIRWILRLITQLAIRLGFGKHWLVATIIKEIRRRGMMSELPSSVTANTVGTSVELAQRISIPSHPSLSDRPTEEISRAGASPALEINGTDTTCSALIDIQHVTYAYPGQQTPALQDIRLQIRQGEYVVLLGHNGSGKSTLARHCNALLTPTDGHVLVAGLDTREQTNHRAIRDTVGMIFQNPDNQIIATVVEDDVAWALTVRGLPVSVIRERVEHAMAAVGISDLRDKAPHRLSGGQRQRLAIAGVFALRPQCIIADEATSQLDPLSRMEIVSLLHQLNREYGLTIIHVTHLLEEAALAQRIVVMEQGQIAMEGTPATIFADLERLRCLKLAIPAPIELAARLRKAGVPVAEEAVTVEAIARELVH
jgi:energy-coupling factor transport system ATP-binding protein